MIPSIVKVPVSLAQQLAAGAIRFGISGVTSLLHRVLPSEEAGAPEAPVSAEPVVRPPRPRKPPVEKAQPTKPASTLDEPAAPIDDDPVVYSSGPEVTESVPAEDLEAIRAEL